MIGQKSKFWTSDVQDRNRTDPDKASDQTILPDKEDNKARLLLEIRSLRKLTTLEENVKFFLTEFKSIW